MANHDRSTARRVDPRLAPQRTMAARSRALPHALVVVAILSACVSPQPIAAQDPAYIASTLWSSALAVGIVDDVAIVLFTAGIATFDVSNAAEPVLLERLTRFDSPGSPSAIEIVGNRAYVASPPDGILVYDISIPSHPVLLGVHPVPGNPVDLQISGDRLYVAAGYGSGVQIFELSDPDKPRYLGGCDTGNACFTLAVWGNHVYCADGLDGIGIVDVTDPENPFLVSTIHSVAYPPYCLEVSEGFLYSLGACGEKSIRDASGLTIHDLSNPANPTPRGIYHSSEGTNRIALRGDLAYIANADGSVTTLDVTDPDAPVEIFETEIGGYAMGIRLDGDRAYIPTSRSGLAILSLQVPSAPSLIGRWWEAGTILDVRLKNGIAYTIDGTFGLHVVDLEAPDSPCSIADLPIPGRPRAVAVAGSLLYVAADSAGVFSVDIADPANPQIVGHVAQYAVDIECDGRYLYTVARDQGMRVIDAIDPQNLQVVAVCPVPGWPSSVSVAAGMACVTNGADLYVIDVSEPEHPIIRGRYDPPEHTIHVTFDGTWAYVCAGNNGVLVIDVSNPDAPALAADLRFDGNTRGTALHNDRLYVPTAGLQVVDVSDPEQPRLLGSSPMGTGLRASVEGPLVCTASGSFLGIFLLDPTSGVDERLPSPGSPAASSTAGVEIRVPNPVRGSTEIGLRLTREERSPRRDRSLCVTLDVLDATGRRVDRIYDGVAGREERTLRWDAARLQAGVYFLRLATEEGVTSRTVVLIR